ncbi:MAG: murein biosynthesis integral membrane protein MurJ [Candidatus Moranbacteria bacterium]|nr:murein biosynthesis integral membrane protein MurJ [Candidatus Moranbacteria bacterium]
MAAFIISLAGIASRFLGFLRDRLLAAQFGAGDTLDAYYAAFRLPDLFYSLIVLGALSAAFLPVFTELRSQGKESEARVLASDVLWWLILALGGVCLLGVIFADSVVSIVAPGFAGEKRDLTVGLTRIMLFSPLFLAVSAVLSGVLMSSRRFIAYSLAPVFYNAGIIFGILVLVPFFSANGLGWGVVVGSLLHMLTQWPAFTMVGWRSRFRPMKSYRNPALRRVVRLMIPRSLSMGVSQMSLLVMTGFASLLVSGSLAAFTLANNIQSVALGIFGVAFSVAVFPALSTAAAEHQERVFFMLLADTTRRILFFVLPISALMIVFRAQFVRVILGSGQFNWEDTIVTFNILALLSVSLFAQSLIPLFSRGFFALQNTRTPLLIACGAGALHVFLLIILEQSSHFSIEMLALVFSCVTIVNFGFLYFMLKRQSSYWDDTWMLIPALKIVLAAVLAGVFAQVSKYVFALTVSELDTFFKVFLQLSFGMFIGGTAYLFLCVWLQIEELHVLRRFIWCRILRQPETLVSAEDHPEKGEW